MLRQKLHHFRQDLTERYPSLDPTHASYRWLVMATVMIATFMAVLDATIVNVALSKLMSTFGVAVDQVEWVLTAYLIAFGVMLPASGWLADHLGYKRMFLLSVFLFTLGSVLCSFAWSINVLIAFRVVQGAGAGILMPVGMAIITREFPPEKRGVALAFWSISASASVSLGPTIGGYLIDNFTWNSIFDVNVPIGIIGMAAVIIILREHKSAEVRRFDLLGLLSMTAFLTALLLALANGNSAWNTGGWGSSFIITCFAVALVGLVIFVITELSVEHPLIEISLFKSYNFSFANLAMFMFGMGMFGSVFLLPIYLQNSLGYTPLQAGMVFLPVGLLQIVSAPLAGQFTDRFGGKLPCLVALLLMAYSFYQYGTLSAFSESREIMIPLYIRGIAMGMLFAPLTVVALSEVPNRKIAQASGLINVIRQIGGSFGVAIFGTEMTRRALYHSAIYGQQLNLDSPMLTQTLSKMQGYSMRAGGGSPAEAMIRAKVGLSSFVGKQAFIQAVGDVFLLAAVFLLISVVPVIFLHSRKRQQRQQGAKVAAME